MRLIFAVALVATLCGCATNHVPPSAAAPINLPPLPGKLIAVSCDPVTLPSGPLSKAQVEQLWARDRARLVKCGYTVGGLITFYEDLSRRFRGVKP